MMTSVLLLGFFAGSDTDLERRATLEVEHRNGQRLAEHLELLDGSGALHVGGDEQRRLALLLEPARELGRGGRLAGPLQADHHHAGGAGVGEGDGLALVAHHGHELFVADAHELIARRYAVRLAAVTYASLHGLAERLLFHRSQEAL